MRRNKKWMTCRSVQYGKQYLRTSQRTEFKDSLSLIVNNSLEDLASFGVFDFPNFPAKIAGDFGGGFWIVA